MERKLLQNLDNKKQDLEKRISIEKKNRVAYISFNKPPANGYEIGFLGLLAQKLKAIETDDNIKVVVIRSALEKFFCGGADIKVFGANTVEQNQEMVVFARKVCEIITQIPKICIGALNGHALGGGLELAMACDIRLASEGDFLLGLPEINLGLVPGNGGMPRLIHLIGAGRAMELLLTGDSIQPQQALQYGLVNHLFPEKTFNKEVEIYAEKTGQWTCKGHGASQIFP